MSSVKRHLHQAATSGTVRLPHHASSPITVMDMPPMQAHPLSLQRDHSTLPEVDTSLFTNPDHGRHWKLTHSPSNGTTHRSRKPIPCLTLLSSWKVRYRNHLNVAVLLAGLHVAHGPSNPTLSSHHHSVGPLEGLGPHDMGPRLPSKTRWTG